MSRRRRRFSPAALGGTAMLALFLAIVLGATVHTAQNTVAGVAFAEPETAPTVLPGGPPSAGDPSQRPAPGPAAPGASAPAPSNAGGTPNPGAPARPAPNRPAGSQSAGTVRLAHGGTATLVRREIGVDGVLPIPSSLVQATWWGADLHAASGASVLAGHVNWHGATGPFAELWNSQVGDPVWLADQTGTRTAYHVTDVITLHKDELAARAEQLFAQDGPHRLVLVTCGGQWVGGTEGYASNRIAIASV